MTELGPQPRHSVAAQSDTGKSCPYCRFPLKEGIGVVQCGACNSIHHDDCWQDNGGCSLVGCVSGPASRVSAPAAPAQPAAPAWSSPPPGAPSQKPMSPLHSPTEVPLQSPVAPPAGATALGSVSRGESISAVGGVALFATMFIEWWEAQYDPVDDSVLGSSVSAWHPWGSDITGLTLLLTFISIFAIVPALLKLRSPNSSFSVAGWLALVAAAAGGAAFSYFIGFESLPENTTRASGAWAGIAACILIVIGGWVELVSRKSSEPVAEAPDE